MCDRMNCVYLLGAGFTRAVMGDRAPLTHELMSKLDIARFPELHDEYERSYPDIEQFLSILDLKILHFRHINSSLSKRLDKVRETIIQQIMNQVDTTCLNVHNLDDFPVLKKFIESIQPNARILTLNYDCVLDQGLYFSKRWSPFGGYCYPTFPHTQNENDSKDRILLLKMHGSCNFKDSQANQDYFNIEITESIFPNIHANINASLNDTPHVLVMSYIKQFHNGIMSLWREAISFLKVSEKLIIVGCSLREEDTFLRFALYHFGMKEKVSQFCVDVIDKGNDNCNGVRGKLMKLIANPDCQQVNMFEGGLADYLN